MANLRLMLLIFAFVCFVLSTVPPTAPFWNRLVGAGLAFATAAVLFG